MQKQNLLEFLNSSFINPRIERSSVCGDYVVLISHAYNKWATVEYSHENNSMTPAHHSSRNEAEKAFNEIQTRQYNSTNPK